MAAAEKQYQQEYPPQEYSYNYSQSPTKSVTSKPAGKASTDTGANVLKRKAGV